MREKYDFCLDVYKRQAARLEAPNPLLENMNVTVRGIVRRNAEGDIDLQHLIVPLYTEGEVTAYCLAVPYLRQGDYPSAENYSGSALRARGAPSVRSESLVQCAKPSLAALPAPPSDADLPAR